jgi:phenylpropionate dioxygenase-like ring-hydroxylating dioxygenase large terminal subunit
MAEQNSPFVDDVVSLGSASRAAAKKSSVARILDDWYVVCASRELKSKPLATTLFGTPIVVFRTPRGVAALLDRCPHRNVPLSLGRVQDDTLVCGYHGWRFDKSGACRHIPCLLDEDTDKKGRRVPAFAAREQEGHVWVYATADVEPARAPFTFPFFDDPRYTQVTAQVDMEGSILATAENALDVPHTAFLHGGLFRTPERKLEIDVVVKRDREMVEAEYIGEPRPSGVIGRLLAPSGGVVTHYDRFLLPSVTQVEYRLGSDSHVVVNAALTPLEDMKTRLFGVAAFRLPVPVPGRLLGRVLRPLALFILGQDARMLSAQTDATTRFGGEHWSTTEVDVLGPHILKLMRDAERGRRSEPADGFERRFRMAI